MLFRSRGDVECSGYELGLSRPQVATFEQLAFDELVASGGVKPAPVKIVAPAQPGRCATPH